MGYIAGIGGANMDIHGKSDRQLIMRDSNPGSLHTSLGGVCRNICENLARLGETVRRLPSWATMCRDVASSKAVKKPEST